ncbi:MAG: SNF2 helicase associated domain-containing protein, partial [Butyrivibrio sp.]|nr:SNF2 helicase associated domain-containing protein [Butyrivibrio sp.]
MSDFDSIFKKSSQTVTASGRRFSTPAVSDTARYTSFDTMQMLSNYANEQVKVSLYQNALPVHLVSHLKLMHDKIYATFNIGRAGSRDYCIKDIPEFLNNINKNENYSYGKELTFVHTFSSFDETSQNLIRFLSSYYKERISRQERSFYRGSDLSAVPSVIRKQIELTGHEIDDFFDNILDSTFYFCVDDFRKGNTYEHPARITYDMPEIEITFNGTENGMYFKLSDIEMFESYNSAYFITGQTIHRIRLEDIESLMPFIRFNNRRLNDRERFISNNDLSLLTTGLLPVLKQYMHIIYNNFDPDKWIPELPEIRIYLDKPESDTITCDLQAVYAQSTFHLFEDVHQAAGRNLPAEKETTAKISTFFDKKISDTLMALQGDDNKIYTFIAEKIPELRELGEVYLSENIHEANIVHMSAIHIGVSFSSNLLELSLVPSDMTNEELAMILSRYDRKKKYYRLKNGDVLQLNDNDLKALVALQDGLHISADDIMKGQFALPKYRALYLDSFEEDMDYLLFEKNNDFKNLIREMDEASSKEYQVPNSLVKIMRDYQKDGFKWLKTLNANGFGAILADDMGLGKTLQVLSFILSEKEENKENHSVSLIVCPASLIYNWQNEIKRFTPSLKSEIATGFRVDRERILSELSEEGTDVIITSYDLLRRDIDLYKDLSFKCQVLDEAQFIKNPGTQASKAAKLIKADFKIALTGTPIENRLSELWSIFDYIMPGFLYNYSYFKQTIETPVVQDKDEITTQHLKRLISPFILRRLKQDVLKDLPEKIEETICARLENEQQDLYKAHLQRLKMMLEHQSDEEFLQGKIMVLAELMKLRQLCCDPALIYDGYNGNSAKT